MATVMSNDVQPLLQPAPGEGGRFVSAPVAFAVAALAFASAAAVLAGWLPIQFSIVTVFLFAGPHNWLEFRYFLTRVPGRLGKLRSFFVLAFVGIVGLTAGFCALLYLMEQGALAPFWVEYGFPVWNSVLLLWIAVLVQMRSRQNPRRDWGWIWPVCLILIAVAWMLPWGFGLGLVYLHPLMAFWLLDRELRRSRPQWRTAFHACLLCLPIFLGLLWWKLADAPPLPVARELDQRIADHAGAAVLETVSSHLLVATHTFLEMLHYGVWVLAIPLVGIRSAPWKLESVPLAKRSSAWRWALGLFLLVSFSVVLILWGCFLADYTTTRTVYFTVALAHVLAEAPFLLRAL